MYCTFRFCKHASDRFWSLQKYKADHLNQTLFATKCKPIFEKCLKIPSASPRWKCHPVLTENKICCHYQILITSLSLLISSDEIKSSIRAWVQVSFESSYSEVYFLASIISGLFNRNQYVLCI